MNRGATRCGPRLVQKDHGLAQIRRSLHHVDDALRPDPGHLLRLRVVEQVVQMPSARVGRFRHRPPAESVVGRPHGGRGRGRREAPGLAR